MRLRFACVALAAPFLFGCSSDGSTPPAEPVLSRIQVTGATSSVVLGTVATIQLSAAGFDQHNDPIAASFTWTSSDNARATVTGSGLVTIVAVGTVSITATAQGVSATVSIEILPIPPAPVVSNLVLDDATNTATAADFEVSFTRPANETRVSGYRLIVVKSTKATSFTVDMANAVPSGRFIAVAKGSVGPVQLPPGALDSDGDAIVEGTPYTAFMLSLADGVLATEHALSAPSNSVKGAQTAVKITFVGDMGVVISDGTRSVLVDALPLNFSVVIGTMNINWLPAAPGLVAAIQAGTPPYHDVIASLVTHDHLDHWASASTAGYFTSQPQGWLIGPAQVVGNFPGSLQVRTLAEGPQQTLETTIDGVRIQALPMKHFNNFGLDFSGVQNHAYLIEIGGRKILHIGDADYTAANFQGLASEQVDVVILPAADVEVTEPNIEAVRTFIAPKNVIAAHLETHMTEQQVKAAWGADVAVFTKSLQFVRY